MAHSIRVVIVDDHPAMRVGLARVLESEADFAVVGEAEDGFKALDVVETLRPDVVLMDYNMPAMDGAEATRRILAARPDVTVIGLSMHSEGPTEKAMLEAGATAYLSKNVDLHVLLSTIRQCCELEPTPRQS